MFRALALCAILALQLALAGIARNDGAVDFFEGTAAAATVGSTTTAPATATPTDTSTATRSPTASATPTVTTTPTVTPTATATPVPQAVGSTLATPSPHPTILILLTSTPTRTPTRTATPTRTPTVTQTPTRTATVRATTTTPATTTTTTTTTAVAQPLGALGAPSIGGTTSTSATISWTTTIPSTGQVRYGQTLAYGATTGIDSVADREHRHILAGLLPATLYHYRVESVDASGTRLVSPDAIFVTPRRGERGAVDDVNARRITSTTAVIGWTGSTSVAQVEYGINPTYGLFTLLQVFTTSDQQITLSNLLPQTLYHYRIRTWDATGASSTTSDFTFATASQRTATLLGNATADERHTVIPGGEAYAFQYTAASSGLATQLRLFVDTFGGTQGVALALYADQAGRPVELLAQGAVQRLVADSWNMVSLPATGLTRGNTYWIAVLNPAGASPLGVRGAIGNGTSRQAVQPALSAFPLAWASGPALGTTTLSVHAVQQVPMVTLTDPADGSTVSGQVNLAAVVDDDSPIVSVQFMVDNLPIGAADPAAPFTAVWDSSPATTHDVHAVTARVTDALGRVSTAAPVSLHVDNGTAFTQVAATPAAPGSVWITWSTDSFSDSQVEFGASAAYGQATLDPSFAWQHRVQLTGLRPGAIYHFRVKSRDLRGVLAASGDYTFSAPPET